MSANSAGKPFVLGITGGIASGKSSAAEYLQSLGAHMIDADAHSHALTANPDGAALPEIRSAFGDEVFAPDGSLDRRALGEIVFADAGKRRTLESILHPMIQREMIREMQSAEARVIVLNIPLLFETAMDALCDEVWVMALEQDAQALRLMNRNRITRQQAEARIAAQMPLAEKSARANRVIQTGRPMQDTRKELQALYADLVRGLG